MKSTPPSTAAAKDGTRRKHVVDEPTMEALLSSYAHGAEIERPADKAKRDRLLAAVRDVQRQRLREAMWTAGTSHAKLASALKSDPKAPQGRAESWLFNSLYNDRLIDREEAAAIGRICGINPVRLTQHLDRLPWLAETLRGRRQGEEPRVDEGVNQSRAAPASPDYESDIDPIGNLPDDWRTIADLVRVGAVPSQVDGMTVRIDGQATLPGLAIAATILDGFELAFGLTSKETVRLSIDGTQAVLEFDVPVAGLSTGRLRIPSATFGLDGAVGPARVSIVASLAPSAAEVERERRIARGDRSTPDDTIMDEIVLRLCTIEGVDVLELVHAVPDDVRSWSSFDGHQDHQTRVRLPMRLPAMSGVRTVRSLDVKSVGLPCSIVLDVFGRSGVTIPDGTAPTSEAVGRPIGEIAPDVHPAIADLRIMSANQSEDMTLYMLEPRPMRAAVANPTDQAAGILLARRLTEWADAG